MTIERGATALRACLDSKLQAVRKDAENQRSGSARPFSLHAIFHSETNDRIAASRLHAPVRDSFLSPRGPLRAQDLLTCFSCNQFFQESCEVVKSIELLQ